MFTRLYKTWLRTSECQSEQIPKCQTWGFIVQDSIHLPSSLQLSPSASPACALPFTRITDYSKEPTTSTAFLVGDPLIYLRVEGLDTNRKKHLWLCLETTTFKDDFRFPVYTWAAMHTYLYTFWQTLLTAVLSLVTKKKIFNQPASHLAVAYSGLFPLLQCEIMTSL